MTESFGKVVKFDLVDTRNALHCSCVSWTEQGRSLPRPGLIDHLLAKDGIVFRYEHSLFIKDAVKAKESCCEIMEK